MTYYPQSPNRNLFAHKTVKPPSTCCIPSFSLSRDLVPVKAKKPKKLHVSSWGLEACLRDGSPAYGPGSNHCNVYPAEISAYGVRVHLNGRNGLLSDDNRVY